MIKHLLKGVGLATLRSTGVFSLLANSHRRNSRLLILCYHGVSLRDEHEWSPDLYVTPDLLRRRFQLLKDYAANVLPLGEALDRLQTGALPPRSVVLTFDDGFYDFRVHALPALQGFGFPCTLYLTTHYCYRRLPIFRLIVRYLLWKSRKERVDLTGFGPLGPVSVGTEPERLNVASTMLEWVISAGMSTAAQDEVARRLAQLLRLDYDDLLRARVLQILSPEEVTGISRAGVEVELHTHRHRTPRNRDLFLREVRDNTASIMEFTGRRPAHFCYPSGDYASAFVPWLKELGVRSATTCELGLAAPGADPFRLPRVLDDNSIASIDLESYLCGLRLR
jgi:peptidoglycan/xylan/chitin deacetylase (PgdA/CDA1 family)